MTFSTPSTLRLRLLSLRPNLLLTEIQLVDEVVLYQCIDGRDHVPTDVRAVRPSSTDWAHLRCVLDEARFWSWSRRWPRMHDGFMGEFAIGVEWAGRAAVSAGPIGVAPHVDAVLDEIERLVGRPLAQRAPEATSAHHAMALRAVDARSKAMATLTSRLNDPCPRFRAHQTQNLAP